MVLEKSSNDKSDLKVKHFEFSTSESKAKSHLQNISSTTSPSEDKAKHSLSATNNSLLYNQE